MSPPEQTTVSRSSPTLSLSRDFPADAVTHAEAPPPRRHLRRWLAAWSRWLHIYLSMFSLAAIFFFSATGLTLNHPDWFFAEHIVERTGRLPTEWLHTGAAAPADWDEADFSHEVAKLEIAERLRAEQGLRGAVSDFLAFREECEITFQSPGYSAIARVNRATGDYVAEVAENDFVTILNDLHKGRHAGRTWSWVVDISAIVGVLVAATGFILIFFLHLRRRTALATAALGFAALAALYVVARH